jgi:nucleotide-binding universal stress UspA family protein
MLVGVSRRIIEHEGGLPMKVLVAFDGSTASQLALETVRALSWPPGSGVEVLSVLPTDIELFGGPWPAVTYVQPTDVRDRLRDERRHLIDEAADALRDGGLDVSTKISVGRAGSVIVEEAERIEADLILVGARGHGALERMFLGSVSAEVVDDAHRPVLVARRSTTRRILLASDGSPDAMAAADFVGASGLFVGATVRVVHVVDVPAALWLGVTPGDAAVSTTTYTKVIEDANQRGVEIADATARVLRAKGLVAVEPVVKDGGATASIIADATDWDADLIVLGTRGHGLLKRLILGSTARTVLHHAPMSVLIVRSSE